jgi:hypothetical protein
MVQRQQNMSEPVPSFFIRTLASLDTSVNDALAKEKEAKKKMNALNARALTAMKQKVKKMAKEFERDLKAFQQVCSTSSFLLTRVRFSLGPRRIRARVRGLCRSRGAHTRQNQKG